MNDNDFAILQPKNWLAPKGYANGIVAEGRQLFIAGQVGWNEHAKLVSDDFVAQVDQAVKNIVQVLAEADGEPRHLVRMTWYLTSKSEYAAHQKEIGQAYWRVIGRYFSAMTAVVVAGLLEEGARVEIEATAVISPAPRGV